MSNNILILSAHTKNIEWNNYGKNDYAEVSSKINKQYADINGYDFKCIVYDTKYNDYWPTWIKVKAILECIHNYDYVFWIDADAIFMNNISLDFLMGKDIALTKGLPTSDIDKTLTMTTTGFMLIKNNEFSINLLNNLLDQAENWDGGSFKESNWHEQGLLDKMYIRPQVIQTYKFTSDYYRLVDHIKEDIENPFETENFKIFPQKYQVEDITDVKFIYHAAAETPTKKIRLEEASKNINFTSIEKIKDRLLSEKLTMITRNSLSNTENCIRDCITNNIEGDFVETGVWKGGSSILVYNLFKILEEDRKVWAYDSFKGLPKPDPINYPIDSGDIHHSISHLSVSLKEVKENFEKFSGLDENVIFVEGWFRDTIPQNKINKICVLRLDGDMYESTMPVLEYLYPKLSVGGYCIIDDYNHKGARLAVLQYRRKYNITDEILLADNDSGAYPSSYWKKTNLEREFVYYDIKNKGNVSYNVSFINGSFCEILGESDDKYKIQFIDTKTNIIVYQDILKANHWTSADRKWYIEWKIIVKEDISDEIVYAELFNLIDKKVFITLESKSIGDTLAWIPYVEEFRKKHNCKVICSTFWNSWFKDEYKEIEFVEPESIVDNLYASYEIGWFYDEGRNPVDVRTIPLQQAASDILGLNFKEIRPKISISNKKRVIHEKYVCIAIQATTQIKYWNCKDGWQKVVDYLNENGYKVVCIDKYGSFGTNDCWNEIPNGVIDKTGCTLEEAKSLLYYADFHMGVSSGLSWLSWSVGTPVILVSSWSKSFAEFQSDCVRVHCDDDDWSGSFNDDKFELDAANWNWNPYKECKTIEDWYDFEPITLQQVKSAVDEMIVKTTVDEMRVETDIKKAYIHFGSSSLGDSIGWIPYCLEYKKKFKVNEVVVSTYWNNLFKQVYPELTFIEPGESVDNINKRHTIDFYGLNLEEKDLFDNPLPLKDYKECSVQGQAINCLGLEHKEIKPKIVIPDKPRRIKEKYVCIAIQSTSQAKYWNLKGGWDAIVKYLRKKGYKVVCIDKYSSFGIKGQYNITPKGVIDKTGDFPIEDRIVDIKHAEFFIGISSGLAWISWAVGTPVVMIAGFSKPWNEFTTNVERVHNDNVCNGCWNTHQFHAANWNWCPENKDFECTKQISFNMVKDAVDNIIGDF